MQIGVKKNKHLNVITYYKPRNQFERGSQINDMIFFMNTDNNTILGSEVMSTRIDRGTTVNTSVDRTKLENMVTTRPWYRKWF